MNDDEFKELSEINPGAYTGDEDLLKGYYSPHSIYKKIGIIILMIVFFIGGIMVAFILPTLNLTPNSFLTDQACNTLILNSSEEAFINGSYNGIEMAIVSITNDIKQCNQIPMSYEGFNYTLTAIECLNLNSSNGGIQK